MKIVVLDGGTLNPGDLSWRSMKKKFGKIITFDQSPREKIVERALKADIIIVNKVIIDEHLINQLPKLKHIAVSATGFNNVDIEACNKRGIQVSNVTNYGSANVAQHVFALLLSLTNMPEHHYQLIKQGEWKKRNVFSFWSAPMVELSGKTMGIIGWGNIGQKVGQIANGFNMNVIYTSANKTPSEYAKRVNLKKLLSESDFISLNTHLSEKTKHIVNDRFLKGMKSSAYLINTSRGGLVDEKALYNALKKHLIAGAGLDVLNEEPTAKSHPLLSLDNCIITPHNAWASIEARQRLMNILEKNIESFIKGKPQNLVN